MAELTTLQKVDKVLEFLATSESARPYISAAYIGEYMKTVFSENDNDVLQRILDQLVKDGYVAVKPITSSIPNPSYHKPPGYGVIGYPSDFPIEQPYTTSVDKYYSITLEGEMLYQKGGYGYERNRISQIERHQRSVENRTLWLTVILAIGASIASIYYVIEIFKFVCGCN